MLPPAARRRAVAVPGATRQCGLRRFRRQRFLASVLAVAGLLVTVWTGVSQRSAAQAAGPGASFDLVAGPGIASCLPSARGHVALAQGPENDVMTLAVEGLPPDTGFDLFITQLPHKPFGLSWYQSDLQTGDDGTGSVTVRGVLDVETFTVATASRPVPPTHQFHLGLWFDDPAVPFNIGCERGETSPLVTPFNGAQHAGIQALTTAYFPDGAGPLKAVTR